MVLSSSAVGRSLTLATNGLDAIRHLDEILTATGGILTPRLRSRARVAPYARGVVSGTSLVKRLVVGRPFRSDRLGETLLSKRLVLPIFASDPLSSVAYATQG